MKYRHYLKVCETSYRMTKHFLTCKVRQDTVHCTVSRNILYKTNNFLIAKIKALLSLIELIGKEESLYIDTLDRKDPVFNRRNSAGIDKATKMMAEIMI